MANEYTSDQYDYQFDPYDHIRNSHVVRIFEDGSIVRVDRKDPGDGSGNMTTGGGDADTPPPPETDPNDPTGNSEDERSYIDVLRTDEFLIERGKGFAYQKTYYHFDWGPDGTEMVDNREFEIKMISPPTSQDGTILDANGNDITPAPDQGDTLSTSTDEPASPVPMPVITSLKINAYRVPTAGSVNLFGHFGAKRAHFDNSAANEGRVVKIKDVNGVKVEVIKKYYSEAATQFVFQGTQFNVPKWADPQAEEQYAEDNGLLQPYPGALDSGGNGGGG